MKLWLDDVREPWKFGRLGWDWVKTAPDAIKAFKTGQVEEASLDHDLTEKQTLSGGILGVVYEDGTASGYDVVSWLEQNPQFWPAKIHVHSANPAGRSRMLQVIQKYYTRGADGWLLKR